MSKCQGYMSHMQSFLIQGYMMVLACGWNDDNHHREREGGREGGREVILITIKRKYMYSRFLIKGPFTGDQKIWIWFQVCGHRYKWV